VANSAFFWRALRDGGRFKVEAALRRQITTDTHSPGEYRSDTVRNVEAWYKAYEIALTDKLYLKPEDRVGIW
jgi:putative endopeptidase